MGSRREKSEPPSKSRRGGRGVLGGGHEIKKRKHGKKKAAGVCLGGQPKKTVEVSGLIHLGVWGNEDRGDGGRRKGDGYGR